MATVALLVAALAGGCAGASDSKGPASSQGAGTPGDSAPADPTSPASPSPQPGDVDVVDSGACEEVRTGIAAFNAGDYEQTVAHFEKALPLAEQQDDGSLPASQLIEAVRYYAELEAGLYPAAAQSSPEFARNKSITLGQCMPTDEETPESPGVQV